MEILQVVINPEKGQNINAWYYSLTGVVVDVVEEPESDHPSWYTVAEDYIDYLAKKTANVRAIEKTDCIILRSMSKAAEGETLGRLAAAKRMSFNMALDVVNAKAYDVLRELYKGISVPADEVSPLIARSKTVDFHINGLRDAVSEKDPRCR